MKKLKKTMALLMSMMMLLSLTLSTSAAENDDIIEGIEYMGAVDYIVYNENNEVVEEGTIPSKMNRTSWNGSITLSNGYSTSFLPKGERRGFLAGKKTSMKFSYKLNKFAKMNYYWNKTNQQGTNIKKWQSDTFSSSGGSITKVADVKTYYYVGVTNMSSSSIKISNVSFKF